MCAVHNVKRVSLKGKVDDADNKVAFYFLGKATRSEAEQQKDREQWRGKPHGSLHDLSVILYYCVISVNTVHWTMYLMWCVCIVGRAHCNGCIGGPPLECERCVVFALLEEIIGGCSAHCAHRWKRSLEGESMRSREQ